MAVLMQFNEKLELTVQEILDATGKDCLISYYFSSQKTNFHFVFCLTEIKQEILLQVLGLLLKTKLLKCKTDENNLSVSSLIELFTAYNKYLRHF